MKKQITIKESLILIIIGVSIAFLATYCDTSQYMNQDEAQPLSKHDSTLLKNYELTH